ncbi:MarR family winged helix-turn-helix transcriptional regulator [Mumia zhuanghuii]|uniref:MarR family transcriptional regulator n=1 Tax=Mumia zhuanghuii TaxID=2585211 RepID=A0A5C4LU88_9ACTN|nr:MarR family transcriptional regulator [Mumia zhuanghuii]TNC21994.1 MarR family transcriptional regulator [Mumia zhuanghuii]
MENSNGLTASLLVAGHHAARLLESHLSATDLSAGEAVLLTALAPGPLTMSEVMSTLHIRASTATSMVSRLERAEYVYRSSNPEDRRSRLVHLTLSGRRQLEAVGPAFRAVDSLLVSRAGVGAVAGYKRVLEALAESE